LRLSSPLGASRFVVAGQKAFVETIEPASDALSWRSDGDRLLGRTFHSITKQFYGNISIVKPSAKVITIEPSADALSMGEVVRLFSGAFEQICGLSVVDKLPEIDKIVRQLQREEALEIKGPVDFVEKVLGILVSCGSSRARL